jgi:hypothetical protein
MDRKVFENTLLKVVSLFGAKNYSQDRINMIFDVVKAIEPKDLERVVNHFVGNSRTAPLVKDFQLAISELGIKKRFTVVSDEPRAPHQSSEDDFVYHVRDELWANNDYVYIRGDRPSFIIKKASPDHPYVLEANAVRSERIAAIKAELRNKHTIPRPPTKVGEGMTKLDF